MLTNEEVQKIREVEIQNPTEGYLYYGSIKTISVKGEGDDKELSIVFNWFAKAVGYPPMPTGWVSDNNLTYGLPLMMAQIMKQPDLRRIVLISPVSSETTVLFEEVKFDTSKIKKP